MGGKAKCIECGKRLSSYSSKRCKKCTPRGKDSHVWKGGLRGKDYIERRRFRNSMQKLVFERDNYTCQLCWERGGKLQVDHIQSWAEYVELRFSMDNCRTLCMDCHYFITYGRRRPENIIWGHNFGRRTLP